MGIFKVLKEMAEQVQNRNRANPKVKTVDSSVFDKIKDAVEGLKEKHEDPDEVARRKKVEAVEELKERVYEVQCENEADPDCETADSSVFTELNEMLEKYKAENAASTPAPPAYEPPVDFNKEVIYEEVEPAPAPAPAPSSNADDRVVALTNSMGGSLALRAEPDMGAAVNTIRIPDSSRLYVLGYSENSIILDGKKSRWVHVDFEGQIGWVLESYLNFN